MKEWIDIKFPGLTNNMDSLEGCIDIEEERIDSIYPVANEEESTDEVRIASSKWWYCGDDNVSNQGTRNTDGSVESQIRANGITNSTGETSADVSPNCTESEKLDFYMVPMIKKNNHRKHNR